jgi:hypothetical protein
MPSGHMMFMFGDDNLIGPVWLRKVQFVKTEVDVPNGLKIIKAFSLLDSNKVSSMTALQ